MLGIAFAFFSIHLPKPLELTLMTMGSATTGSALFLTGLVVSAQAFRLDRAVVISVLAKNIMQSAFCLLLAIAIGGWSHSKGTTSFYSAPFLLVFSALYSEKASPTLCRRLRAQALSPPTLPAYHYGWMDGGAQPFTLKCRVNLSAILPHYLLEVNAAEVIPANDPGDQCVPSWVFRELRETPLVVVRRGVVTQDRIPVGIRGQERSQRWAAICPLNAIEQIVTPTDLLNRFARTRDLHASPAYRALRLLAVDWQWFTHSCWGPGGSLGFELATGKRTITPQSDLDIVVYANAHLSRSDAQRLLVSTRDLEVAVDIRVETPVCGFALAEYVKPLAGSILLRTAAGPILGDNPWNEDLGSMSVPIEDWLR
jgi:phosphoribosyl-dephospho-CoA transferase